ncbi:putative GTP cyclohydrolase 1 type 2 [mine drainage metagenome]|uniref:Putative GTP cyclohydrolase 1 type 2 n=1 Tax=mine drainage metagenome TaxID=410659 RepID=A0A1J5QT22_9ZZZZ
MKLIELLDYTGQLLQVERYRDYCPNGLQVAGRPDVGSIVSGVSASMALLEAAAENGADMVLVHHGYFWKNEQPCVTGIKRARLKYLLERDINLVAYHLPLDAHPQLGNNAQLARMLGIEVDGWFGEQSLVAHGRLAEPVTLAAFGRKIAQALGREPLLVGEAGSSIRRVAWCTGAAQDALEQAVEMGVDAFVTGEVSERTVHLARESGVAFIAAGHHATERYGVQALGEHLANRYGIRHRYVEIDNPV